jgi:hypothetical protein
MISTFLSVSCEAGEVCGTFITKIENWVIPPAYNQQQLYYSDSSTSTLLQQLMEVRLPDILPYINVYE